MSQVKVSRARSIGLAVLLLSGQGSAWAQEAPAASEPARAPAPELTPPPLIPAQDDWDAPTFRDGDAPPGQETEGPHSVSEQALPDKGRARPADPVPRVAVEFVAGAGGGIVAGTVGLVTGFLVGASTVGCDECGIVAGVGGLSGLVVGIPAGTWLGGKLMGGQGTWSTVLFQLGRCPEALEAQRRAADMLHEGTPQRLSRTVHDTLARYQAVCGPTAAPAPETP